MAEQAKKGKPVMAESTGSQSAVTPQMRETGSKASLKHERLMSNMRRPLNAFSARWKIRLDKLGPAHERSTSG